MATRVNNNKKLQALRELKKRATLNGYRSNFESFAREQIKVLPKDVSKGFIPFEFNSAQHIINDAVENQLRERGKVRVIILKARQMGISTWATSRVFWRAYLNPHHKSVVMAHDAATSDALFNMSRNIIDCMPPLFRPAFKKSNAKEIMF